MSAALTPRQLDTMRALSNHVGKTVDVLTTQYERSVNPTFAKSAVTKTTWQTLKGLRTKGYITIGATFWRGCTVTVLRGLV